MSRYEDNFEDTQLNCQYNRYSEPNFPQLTQPKIVGYFSVDGEQNYVPSAENLKYLKLPVRRENVSFDLNKGYEQVRRKPDSPRHGTTDNLLKSVINNKSKFLLDDCETTEEIVTEKGKMKYRSLNMDIVAFRGLLRVIMCTPYENQVDWCILASKFGSTIYLCQKETEQQMHKKQNETERDRKFCSYGFKFEQYLLSDDPTKNPNTDEPVNEAEEFCCMFERKLGDFKLLYGAEMDGVQSEIPFNSEQDDLNNFKFIELKVKRRETSFNQERNFIRFKSRNWWCQSFLVGIQNIFVGLRNDKGIVDEIKEMKVESIARQGKEHWSTNVCADFLLKFLQKIKTMLENVNCPYSVYQFYWNPESNKVKYKIFEGKNDLTFLPEWYIKEMKI